MGEHINERKKNREEEENKLDQAVNWINVHEKHNKKENKADKENKSTNAQKKTGKQIKEEEKSMDRKSLRL